MAKQYPDLGPFEWNPVAEELTIRGGPFTAPSILIAASDAPESSKLVAFRVCKGQDDQDDIRAAISELLVSGVGQGGTIRLTEGTYSFSTTLILDTLNNPAFLSMTRGISIKGAGHGTRINYNGSDPVIDLGSYVSHVVIENLDTDAGGIDPNVSQWYILRYWKSGGWIELYGLPSSLQVANIVLPYDVSSWNLIALPQRSVVSKVEVLVIQAFNSDGTDEISVGLDADLDALALPVDVSTLGSKVVLAGAYLGTMVGDWLHALGATVVLTYTAGGSAPTTGMALVTVYHYVARF